MSINARRVGRGGGPLRCVPQVSDCRVGGLHPRMRIRQGIVQRLLGGSQPLDFAQQRVALRGGAALGSAQLGNRGAFGGKFGPERLLRAVQFGDRLAQGRLRVAFTLEGLRRFVVQIERRLFRLGGCGLAGQRQVARRRQRFGFAERGVPGNEGLRGR